MIDKGENDNAETVNTADSGTDHAAKLSQELLTIVSERQDTEAKMDAAKSQIVVSGSAEYNAAEQSKETKKNPDTGIVELHYASSSGSEVIVLGTEHRYTADDPEITYLDNLVRQIPEGSKKVLILEGQYGDIGEIPADPVEAIKVAGGEFGYMAALAKQLGIEFVPAEPDPHRNAEKILAERPDITRDELALHYALKTLVGVFRQSASASLQDVAPYIHHSVGIAGNTAEGGWVGKSTSRNDVLQLTDDERSEIMAEMPDIVMRLNAEFNKIKPGETLLDLQPDGTLTLLYDLTKQPVMWDPAPELSGEAATKMTEISRLDMLMRDRHTFELTQQALERGQEPIIVVGSSHVSTLRPAFEAAFAT